MSDEWYALWNIIEFPLLLFVIFACPIAGFYFCFRINSTISATSYRVGIILLFWTLSFAITAFLALQWLHYEGLAFEEYVDRLPESEVKEMLLLGDAGHNSAALVIVFMYAALSHTALFGIAGLCVLRPDFPVWARSFVMVQKGDSMVPTWNIFIILYTLYWRAQYFIEGKDEATLSK